MLASLEDELLDIVGGGGGGSAYGDAGRAPQHQRKRSSKRGLDFGPSGHDYARAAVDADGELAVPVSEVDALLARRLRAKIAADYGEADALQDQLRSLGVEINDRIKEWRADGSDEEWRLAGQRPREEFRGGGSSAEGGRRKSSGGGGGVGGGRGGRREQERRLDGDQGAFTKREFVDFYGGYEQWDNAPVAHR